MFRVEGRRHMPPIGGVMYPQVSYRTRAELRDALVRAARVYWPALRGPNVTHASSDWRECRGRLAFTLPGGHAVDAHFSPVYDLNRPAEVQARRPEGER